MEEDSRKCSPEDLEQLTSHFSPANLIGKTQFGSVYRGKTQQGQDVTVKIWEDVKICCFKPCDKHFRLMDELTFLSEPRVNHHPSLAKLREYCCEDRLVGVVYDLKPVDTVHNLIVKEDFFWLNRIKVALGFARLLEFLHDQKPPYLVRNIDAAHIMLDQDYNPILFDFGMLTGGVLGDRQNFPNKYLLGCQGYIDPTVVLSDLWIAQYDVFSFGVVLLGLISKRRYDWEKVKQGKPEMTVYNWAEAAYKPKKLVLGFTLAKSSLVHESLKKDLGFSTRDGYKITELAIRCVQLNKLNLRRPTMREVVQSLEGLDAVC